MASGVSAATRENQQTVEIAPRVFAHGRNDKDDWSLDISPEAEVAVISDSNLKSASSVPKNWELHVFSGARARYMTSLLKYAVFGRNLRVIIVHVGINHKYDDHFFQGEVEEMIAGMKKARVRTMCMGISTCNEMSGSDVARSEYFNSFLKSRLAGDYIFPLKREYVRVDPGDPYAIHYTPGTATRIIDSIAARLVAQRVVSSQCEPSDNDRPYLRATEPLSKATDRRSQSSTGRFSSGTNY